jgi:hypothetical protein
MELQKKESMWEIAARYFEAIEESQGEITPAVEAAEMEIMQKVDACRFVSEMLEDQSTRWNERVAYAKAKQKALDSSLERMNKNLMGIIMRAEKTELSGNESVAKLVRNPKSLKLDEKELHPMMLMQVTETVPDKKRIRELLDSGHEISGAKYEHSFRIKWVDVAGKQKEIK